MTVTSRLRGRLSLEMDGSPFLGVGRLDLLAAVAEHGSITQAAKAIGISYKTAWDAVDAMNNQADQPLVTSTPGGRRGGGTHLTEYGKRVLQVVRGIEQEYQQALCLLEDQGQDFAEYRRLLRQFSLRSSARNLWAGGVVTLQGDRLHTQVGVAIDPKLTVYANISTESSRQLGLTPGVEVFLLVKAVSVHIRTLSEPARLGSTEKNEYLATVLQSRREPGRVELTAALSDERTVTAVVSSDETFSGVAEGQQVHVSIDPNSVLLVLT